LSFDKVFGADEGTCPSADGAVARENTPPVCFLTRALQVPLKKEKTLSFDKVFGADEGN